MSLARIGVVVLPPPEIQAAIIRMAELVHGMFPLSYVQDGKRFHPHLTLFQAHVLDRDIAVHEVVDVVRRTPGEVSVMLRAFRHSRVGYLSFHCTVSPTLYRIHEGIVRALQPLVDRGAKPVPGHAPAGLSDAQATSAWEYGYPFALKEFEPHITVGRLTAHDVNAADFSRIENLVMSEVQALEGKRFAPAYVALCDFGVDGACTGIRESTALPRS